MADRENHYEAAFEAYLRARAVPYVAVDETKRALAPDQSLKSLDFIVSAPGQRWLVDVKGRKFPSGQGRHRWWKNWSTRDDLRGLASWERLFGREFSSYLVFAFVLLGTRSPLPPEQLFAFRARKYAFLAITHLEFATHARLVSPKWDAMAVPIRRFRALARPVESLLAIPATNVSSDLMNIPTTSCERGT